MKHALSNVDAIYREYPFLEKIFPRIKIQRAYVERWDDDLLSRSAVSWSWGERGTFEFYLLDEHGNIVTRVGEGPWWFKSYTRDENLGQALSRIGNEIRRVHSAVSLGSDLRFYKIPAGFTNADDWFRSRIVTAQEEMRRI